MNRAQLSPNTLFATGTATVVANPSLTLLSVSDSFRAFFAPDPDAPEPDALFRFLPAPLAVTLRDMLALGQPHCEYCSVSERTEKTSENRSFHIFATRIDGLHHNDAPVYHLVCMDLSELAEKQRLVDLEKRKYDILSDITDDITFEYDFASDTMTYGEKYQRVFGATPEILQFRERLGKKEQVDTISNLFHAQFLTMTVSPENPPEAHVCTTDNVYRWFSLFCTTLEDKKGTPIKAIGAIRNIDRQKREQIRLLDKSRLDAMTGLLNKTTTEEEIREALCDVHTHSMGALLMIDIDNFKSVNDTLGHLAGDAVISQLARQFLRTFRQEDIIGRVGGDEFHVYMRGVVDIESVRTKAHTLCSSVAALFANSELENIISISIGCTCTDTPMPYGELFRQADVALYHAKDNGKNRYEFFGRIDQKEEEQRCTCTSPLATRTARNSIVVDIIDTLFSMGDIRMGIDKTLEFIGNALRVSTILIYEKSFDRKSISITHEWAAEATWRKKHLVQKVPVEELNLPQPKLPGGIYYCNDIYALPLEEHTFSKDPAVTSFLQCDIVREGMVVGLISFEECGHKRIWTQQEIDALVLMAKLIGGHIRQKQSATLLQQSNEAMRTILDSLPGTFVCVTSTVTYKLLYFNNRIREQFPHARLGMTCYQVFKNGDQPCENCLQRHFANHGCFLALASRTPFADLARISISSLFWENREPASVALISEHEPSQEERRQQQKKESYIHALCNIYDYVIDVDCNSGQYELLALAERTSEHFTMTGDYNTVHTDLATKAIFPEEKDFFCKRFTLQGMLESFTGGTPMLEMEYRLQYEGGPCLWKIRTALPYTLEDGSLHILTFIRDITEQKAKELRNSQEQANYLLALQSTYTEIFNFDLESGQVVPLYYNSEQCVIATGLTTLTRFFTQRAHNRVHPDDFDNVIAFYSPETLKKRLRTEGVIEIEYRKRQTETSDYRWIVATVRPVPGSTQNAILLLRDVTRTREEEANFYSALKDNYAIIYEVDLDTDTMRHTTVHQDILNSTQLNQSYSNYLETLGKQTVHPEDKEAVLSLFSLDSLRSHIAENKKMFMEHRLLDIHGNIRWVSVWALPMPTSQHVKALVLLQDNTEAKRMENANRRLERRYNSVFRQSCDIVTELSLDTGLFTRTCFTGETHGLPMHGHAENLFGKAFACIHPDDRDMLHQKCTLKSLRIAALTGDMESTRCQFRLNAVHGVVWMESRAFFVHEDGETTVFFLARDISAIKKQEEERFLEGQRFTIALRDIYTEIYELDIENNTSTLLFANSPQLRPVGVNDLVKTQDIIEAALHPDDRKHVAKSFSSENLHACFSQGQNEVTEEFRRLGCDNCYHWVSAHVVPLPKINGIANKTMMLIKDISQSKARELQERRAEQYHIALRNIYDELYEFNITQNTYQRIYSIENNYITTPERGLVSETTPMLAATIIHPDDRDAFFAFFDLDALNNAFKAHEKYAIIEYRRLCHDGTFVWVSMTMFPVKASEDDEKVYLTFNLNIDTQKKLAEITQQNALLERRRLDDERYRIIMEQTNTLVFEWCPETDTHYISPELMERFSGNYDERNLLRIWKEDNVIHKDDTTTFEEFIEDCQRREHAEMTVRLCKRDESFIWCKVVLSCLHGSKSQPHRYIGTLNDVDTATRSRLALQYRAEYNTLTGVYNMQAFHTRAAQLLRDNPDRNYSIIRMDIDRFKVINDLYGMEAGDLLLKAISRLLTERMSPHSVCGHIGGDVFCTCVDFTQEQILDFVSDITNKLAEYPLTSRIVPSFGICRVDSSNTPINVLCDWANLALKTVKGNVLVGHAFYDGTLRKRILEEKKIETEMYDSLIQQEFTLYLQPKVHIPTSRIVGSEGLVRWRHPADGVIPPARFIPLFEKNGFIIRLDEYIWEQACMVLRRWTDAGLAPTPISVNVSRMHIHDTRLCEKLVALLKKYDLPPHMLELELTESVFLDSETQLFDAIKELRQCGFLFSLDDFGAGYSSLNMLKSLPIKTVKIDRGFLNEVVATERGKTIIRHAIALAQDLDMEVVAEGVETREQATFLLSAGCSVAQGFYYAPPLPIETFEKLAFNNDHPFVLERPLYQEYQISDD